MTSEIRTSWPEEGYADNATAARAGSDIEVEFVSGDAVLLPASRFGVAGTLKSSRTPKTA